MFVDLSTVSLVWPEFILILIATWIYLGGTMSPGRTLWTWMAIVTYLVAFLLMLRNETTLWQEVSQGFVGVNGPLIIDYLGQVSRYGCLLVGLLLTLVASRAGIERLATEVLGTHHDAGGRLDAGVPGERIGVPVCGAGVDFDPHLRVAVSGTPRPGQW